MKYETSAQDLLASAVGAPSSDIDAYALMEVLIGHQLKFEDSTTINGPSDEPLGIEGAAALVAGLSDRWTALDLKIAYNTKRTKAMSDALYSARERWLARLRDGLVMVAPW